LVIVGCGDGGATPLDTSEPVESVAGERAPGVIVSKDSFLQLGPELRGGGIQAWRAEYRSTKGSDLTGTTVSGAFFAPESPSPPGGRPVVVIAHGTTGNQQGCGPSNFSDLFGYSASVAKYVEAGYVVAVPDYQGLGPADSLPYPYLEPYTAGFNVIDSVRAARNLFPDTSTKWLAMGGSAGGQATWAANETAGSYGSGLQLLGTASLSPPVDLTSLGQLIAAKKANSVQRSYVPMIVAGFAAAHPDRVRFEDYLSPRAIDDLDLLIGCRDRSNTRKNKALAQLAPSDTQPRTASSLQALQDWLASTRLPQKASTAPMLIGWGGKDAIVPPESVRLAVLAACRKGSVVTVSYDPRAGHDMSGTGTVVEDWLNDRLAGLPALNDCSNPSLVNPTPANGAR
jgi:pimeloyl-ACP methyl ester carboxylesterase